MPFCPYCGSATVPDGEFCPNCGRKLPTRVELPTEPEAEPPYPQGLSHAPASVRTDTVPSPPPASEQQPLEPPTPFALSPAAGRSALPPEFAPPMLDDVPASNVNPSDLPGTHPDWKMSPAEPYAPTRQRPQWLLIVGAVLGACLLLCLALVVFLNTPPGKQFMANQANQATQAARSATAVPTGATGTPLP